MNIEISALDTLFFRDGKPFEMNNENWATGMFPPLPSVFYGAIRSTFLGQNSEIALEQNITDSESLVINSLFLKSFSKEGYEDEIILPIPLDLISFKDSDESELLDYQSNDIISSKQQKFKGYLRFNGANKKTEELAGKAFLRELDFSEYLQGTQSVFTSIKIQENISLESKIGIGRDNNTNVADKGLLYRVGMLRPVAEDKSNFLKEFRFVINFKFQKDIEISSSGLMKLGGENKVANYTEIKVDNLLECPEITSEYFKVYLSTPAIFENGWCPKFLEDKILTCAIGKPQMVGGFDISKKMPKVMQKAVPSGSVYYVKANSIEEAKKITQNIHGKSISEYRQKEGFGICYIAKISQPIN